MGKSYLIEDIWIRPAQVCDDHIRLTNLVDNFRGQFGPRADVAYIREHLEPGLLNCLLDGILDAPAVWVEGRDNEYLGRLHQLHFTAWHRFGQRTCCSRDCRITQLLTQKTEITSLTTLP